MHSHHTDDMNNVIAEMLDADSVTRLINEHIEQHPNWATPDEARTKRTAVPVWALIGHVQAVNGDIEEVAKDYELETDVVKAAVAYYQRNRDAIAARLAANADSSASMTI